MKTVEEIIINKSFEELNASEKLLIKDLASNEHEFLHTKKLLLSVATLSQTEIIRPSVKTSLDTVFNSKFQLPHTQMVMEKSVPRILPFYNTLWFRAAAVFVIGIGVAAPIYLFSTKVLENESKKVAQLEKTEPKLEQGKIQEELNSDISNSTTPSKKSTTFDASSSTTISVEDNVGSSESKSMKLNSISKNRTSGKYTKGDNLAGLPMFKRKSPEGSFIFTSIDAESSTEGIVSTYTAPAISIVSNYRGSVSSDFIQPETTDLMLDIIQSVY